MEIEQKIASSDNQHYEKIGKTVKCIEDETPFEIPENWAWCRLGAIIELISGQDQPPSGYNGTMALSNPIKKPVNQAFQPNLPVFSNKQDDKPGYVVNNHLSKTAVAGSLKRPT